MIGLMKRTSRQRVVLALLLGFTMVAAQANADILDPRAEAEGPNGFSGLIPLGAGGVAGVRTYDLKAYSIQFKPVAAGPNAPGPGTWDSTIPGPAANVAAPDNTIRVGGFNIFGWRFGGNVYGPPVVGFVNKNKPGIAVVEKVTSTSGNVFGAATADFIANTLRASALVPLGTTGEAAAEAVDPFNLLPDTYEYSYTISQIELETGKPTDWAGVTFFALDSRFTDPLWALAVVADGSITSSADLLIEFHSNPDASAFFSVDDSLIESQVRAAFNVSGGIASLMSFELFRTDYIVDQTIQYGVGLNAGVEAVPEPSGLLMMGSGLLLVGLGRFVRRRIKEPKSTPTVVSA